jgi:phosphoribosylformylglycinamidine cyclo-ligase
LHTNGYSLARRVVFEELKLGLEDRPAELEGQSLKEALLAVHRSYFALLWPLLEKNQIAAMAHITGGGLVDNLPRVLGTCDAWIDRSTWTPPPLFRFLCERGRVAPDESYQVFNMGIGMVLVVDPAQSAAVEAHLRGQGEDVLRIGKLEKARGAEGEVRWVS